MKNIVLIGMPGAGKSTMGVILAKTLGRTFVDTDILVQEHAGRLLQEIINREGPGAFLEAEEETIISSHVDNAVIATGGSVVFSGAAMDHLKENGVVVYLDISFGKMRRRLGNVRTRGIVLVAGQSLREMYDQRRPLYEKYADITIACAGRDFEQTVKTVLTELSRFPEK